MPHNSRYSTTNPNVVHETIDGETIVLRLDTGVYYSLNDFGGEVWSLVGRGYSRDEIAAICALRYDAAPHQVAETATALVDDLERDLLIVVDETAPTRADGPPPLGPATGARPASRRALRLPVMRKYEDMQDLLLIDPFHDVPAEGWPEKKPDDAASLVISSSLAAS